MQGDPMLQHSTLARFAAGVTRWGARHARMVLLVVGALTLAAVPWIPSIRYDDDVIKFLPQGDPEVERFRVIGRRFGGLSVALVGLAAPAGEDVFTLERLRAVRAVTRAVRRIEGVGFATSLTALRDVGEAAGDTGESMAVVRDLVGPLPQREDAAWRERVASLRKRVLSLPHVAGWLVSRHGDAALVLCHIEPDASPKQVAEKIAEVTHQQLAAHRASLTPYFGGAPFIGAYVAETTREDLARLSPLVAAVVLLVVLATARTLTGALAALAPVLVTNVWVVAAMAATHTPLTLVSSSLPVLIVALGCAYAVHLLARVLAQLDAGQTDRLAAALDAATHAGPPIFVAGLTTAFGFLSFQVMDIAPMREFGLWMSGATVLAVLLSLLLVPALCVHLPLRPQPAGRAPTPLLRLLLRAATGVARHPVLTSLAVVGLVAASAIGASQVQTHMETRRFFPPDSPPVQAEDFLVRRFGGSLYLQVQVTGDIRHPAVLRNVDRLADAAAAIPGVGGAQSIAQAFSLAARALTGDADIPASERTARAIAALLEEDPNIRMLVDPGWTHALVQIKVGGFDTRRATSVAATLRRVLKTQFPRDIVRIERKGAPPAALETERRTVAQDVAWILAAAGMPVTVDALASVLAAASTTTAPGAVEKRLRHMIHEAIDDDEIITLAKGASADELAQAVTELWRAHGSLPAEAFRRIVERLAAPEEREDPDGFGEAVEWLRRSAEDIAHAELKKRLVEAVEHLAPGPLPSQVRERVGRAVGALTQPMAIVPASVAGGARVVDRRRIEEEISGYPMVYAGMNRSVYRNQVGSLLAASVLVLVALAWFFRSLLVGLAAGIPAGITLLVVFGTMGYAGIPLDVGTSMIASISLGVGIDYAVHLLWRHGIVPPPRAPAALEAAMGDVGWGIIINALEVAGGFALLTLGRLVPMVAFGQLTALAMLVSATATLLLMPALARGVGAIRQWRLKRWA